MAGQQQQQQAQQQSQQQQQQGEGRASNSTRSPPEPDNRTWWQRNWVFCMAGGMMVLNMVLKATVGDLPQQGGAPAGRPGPRR